ncbi:hypothetical protein HMPREF0880_00784 [Yokenella regensburgei ATCC 43003]|jgi:hypothetical protein|nr:hypothetical protein HMPREF0880_00784 [Yokenella regensburgei ATCC 43003]
MCTIARRSFINVETVANNIPQGMTEQLIKNKQEVKLNLRDAVFDAL